MTTVPQPPRVGLRLGRRTFPAIPVSLAGDHASLLFLAVPPAAGEVQLVLDWSNGAVTELSASVRAVEEATCLVDLDVKAVEGDWQPFLAYLGTQTS